MSAARRAVRTGLARSAACAGGLAFGAPAIAALAVVGAACDDGGPWWEQDPMVPDPVRTVSADPVPEATSAGPAPLRRLSRAEYVRTVRDLFGIDAYDGFDGGAVPDEPQTLGFEHLAASQPVDVVRVEGLMLEAERLSIDMLGGLLAELPCPSWEGESMRPCGRVFVLGFGRRAFRRPLTADEEARYMALFEAGSVDDGFDAGVQLVTEVMLQSPGFLYRVEVGLPGTEAAGHVRLTPWEMATRLSYALWGTMPDDELSALADSGGLVTASEVEEQARRMLADPRAWTKLGHFFEQWLPLGDTLHTLHLHSPWAVFDETTRFLQHVLFDSEGTLAELLTAPYSIWNSEAGTHYLQGAWAGFDALGAEPLSDGFHKVPLDPTQAAGLLTQGALVGTLSRASPDVLTAPIKRGRFVREQLLCQPISPPPADVPLAPPELVDGQPVTPRERLAVHTEDATCAACHDLMDPLGLPFETYDEQGRWRDVYADGLAIDVSGEFLGTEDIDGPFEGVVELAQALASSRHVADCHVRQWFRFILGRTATSEDAQTLAWLEGRFQASGGHILELLVDFTQTDAFLYRQVPEG